MRRAIFYVIMILGCFLLQCTLFESLQIANVSPNLLIILTASIGFIRGRKEGLMVGFFSGILLDLLSSTTLGFYAVIYMFAGYINGYFRKNFYPENVKLPIFSIALTDFLCNIAIYICVFIMNAKFAFGYYLGHTIFPELIYTMVVAIVLYSVIMMINRRIEEKERKAAAKFVSQ